MSLEHTLPYTETDTQKNTEVPGTKASPHKLQGMSHDEQYLI